MALSRRMLNKRRFMDPFDMFFMDPFEEFSFAVVPKKSQEKESKVGPFIPLLAVDLIESEKDYHIHVDLPGVSKEDLDISFEDGVMTLKAERKEVIVSDSPDHTVHTIERSFGKIQRNIHIPKNADVDKIQANLKDGVLNITLPKVTPSEKVKRIRVQ